jgi:hypothetical protein
MGSLGGPQIAAVLNDDSGRFMTLPITLTAGKENLAVGEGIKSLGSKTVLSTNATGEL